MGHWDDMDEAELIFRMEHAAALESRGPWSDLLVLTVRPDRRQRNEAGRVRRLTVSTKASSVRVSIECRGADSYERWSDYGETPIELLLSALDTEGLDPSLLRLERANELLAPSHPDSSQGVNAGFDESDHRKPATWVLVGPEVWKRADHRRDREAMVATVWREGDRWHLGWEGREHIALGEPRTQSFATRALACTWAHIVQAWSAQHADSNLGGIESLRVSVPDFTPNQEVIVPTLPSVQQLLAQEQRLDYAFSSFEELVGPLQDVGTGFVMDRAQLLTWEREGRPVPQVSFWGDRERDIMRAGRVASERISEEQLGEMMVTAWQALLDFHQAGQPRGGPVEAHFAGATSTLGYWVFFLPVLAPGPVCQVLMSHRLPAFRGDNFGEAFVSGVSRVRDGLRRRRVDISVVETFWEFLGTPLNDVR